MLESSSLAGFTTNNMNYYLAGYFYLGTGGYIWPSCYIRGEINFSSVDVEDYAVEESNRGARRNAMGNFLPFTS